MTHQLQHEMGINVASLWSLWSAFLNVLPGINCQRLLIPRFPVGSCTRKINGILVLLGLPLDIYPWSNNCTDLYTTWCSPLRFIALLFSVASAHHTLPSLPNDGGLTWGVCLELYWLTVYVTHICGRFKASSPLKLMYTDFFRVGRGNVMDCVLSCVTFKRKSCLKLCHF